MKNELKITDANRSMLDRAHRMGKKQPNYPRSIVVKFASSKAKDTIFKNVHNLAGKKKYGVHEQLPPEVQERRRRLMHIFKEAKTKAKTDRTVKVSWVHDKVKVNGKIYAAEDEVRCINPAELQNKVLMLMCFQSTLNKRPTWDPPSRDMQHLLRMVFP
jgi:hypothetical protein